MSSDLPHPAPLSPGSDLLYISEIRIELPINSSKSVKAAELLINGEAIVVKWESKGGGNACFVARLKLDPPRSLPPGSRLLLNVHLSKARLLGTQRTTEPIAIPVEDLSNARREHGLTWKQTFNDLTISVKIAQGLPTAPPLDSSASVRSMSTIGRQSSLASSPLLIPTTDEILTQCPRFRILVMGKTGAGKSLLINKTFGVDDAFVSENEPGYADIHHEIYSQDNPHFVLHDSMGFELGQADKVRIVKEFIQSRTNREAIGENVHAIWLCIAIPVTGGRLLEKGVEELLKLKETGQLGNVPIINTNPALFEELSALEVKALIDRNAMDLLYTRWVKAFERDHEGISHIYVCARDNHERNLAELVQLTYDEVQEYFADASIVSAMAQRVSPILNIKGSIAVGKRKYWSRLARSLAFQGRPLLQCVDVIHADIIGVWGFNDPRGYLPSGEFKRLISKLVDKEDGLISRPNANRALLPGVSVVAGLAGIATALSTVAAPIVLPIAAAAVFAKWVSDVYEHTTFVVERLMTYIVDLSLVLQNLFWIQALRHPKQPVTRRLIKAAVKAYAESNVKQALVFKIEQHVKDGPLLRMGPDSTLTKIEELLHEHIIDSMEILSHRGALALSESRPDEIVDEDWDADGATNDWRRITRDNRHGRRGESRPELAAARAEALS